MPTFVAIYLLGNLAALMIHWDVFTRTTSWGRFSLVFSSWYSVYVYRKARKALVQYELEGNPVLDGLQYLSLEGLKKELKHYTYSYNE